MPVSFNLEEIFKKYKNKVYWLALSISRNEKDAEDVTQDTFLKVIRNIGYFQNRSSISTWIYKIAYNEALMLLRKRNGEFRLSGFLKHPVVINHSGLFVNWAKLPDRELLDNELKERMDLAIRQLPIKYRMPLLLENVLDMPLKEASSVLGIKIGSVKTRLYRAHLAIRLQMSDYLNDSRAKEFRKDRNCGRWTKFIYDYAKGGLARAKEDRFRKHIKDCKGCNVFLNSYVKAINLTGALECRDMPDELVKNIETFLRFKHLNYGKRNGGKYGKENNQG